MKVDNWLILIPAVFFAGQVHGACTPEASSPTTPIGTYDAGVESPRSARCANGKSCAAGLECGDAIHCPEGKCCEILGPGNDAGVTAGTRRVVGVPR